MSLKLKWTLMIILTTLGPLWKNSATTVRCLVPNSNGIAFRNGSVQQGQILPESAASPHAYPPLQCHLKKKMWLRHLTRSLTFQQQSSHTEALTWESLTSRPVTKTLLVTGNTCCNKLTNQQNTPNENMTHIHVHTLHTQNTRADDVHHILYVCI